MKSITFCIIIYTSALSFLISCQKPPKKSAKFDNIQKLMEQEFNLAKDPFSNTVPRERLLEAMDTRDAKLNSIQTLSGIQSMMASVSGINWQERGPANIGGRTRALWFDLSDAANGYKKVWAGGVCGGLWYTNDITVATPVWTKVNDALDNMAISCFVQDPSNTQTMYFGTGEGWENIDAVRGLGIWKTTDGGANWTRLLSTSTFYFIQDLLIDSNGHLYAAVRVNNQGGGTGGIQKSTDGGNTWTTVLNNSFASSSRGGDLELSANGDIYVSMGTATSNGGIYRSVYATHTTNTGNNGNWVNITPDVTGTIATPSNFWQRIELACAPSDANTVYAVLQGHGSSSDDCESIQRYNASTNTWTVGTVPNIVDQGNNSVFTRSQAFYNLIAAVDPNNSNSLYIGGIDALRSDDGGSSWTQMTTWSLAGATGFTSNQSVHADHHAIRFAPGSSSRVIWGTDGGVYYTANANITGAGNKPSFTSKNNGYNVTQYYSAAVHPSTTNYFLAGAQDNGTHKFTASSINNVTLVSGGDGGFCHIDQDNPNIQISSYVLNNYYVSTDGGTSFSTRTKNDRGSFINPTDYDDAANILYAGDNAGTFFRWTSPSTNGIDEQVTVPEFAGASIRHVAVSSLTANRVYFGLSNGSVVRVDNANTGTSLTGTVIKAAVGSVSVSCIVIDPANENHMLVTYSNYGASVVNVFESTNALAGSPTFTSVEGDLPDMPVRWAMFDPRNSDWALLATELGVWSTDNLNAGATTNWNPTNSGLANVRVDMFQYRSSDRTIVAATHGRGLFTAVVPSVTTADINFATATTASTEQVATVSGCRSYTDHTVLMTIANAPVGNANITVNVMGGATATQGTDYDYTTNGSFITPGNTVVFANGGTESKTVSIRIYNDAQIESSETFTLSYTISGSTDAQAGIGAQTHAVTITDNDAAPVITRLNIWTENWETNSFTLGGWTTIQAAGPSTSRNMWLRSTGCFGQITNLTAQVANRDDVGPPITYYCGYDQVLSEIYLYKSVNATGLSDLQVQFDYKAGGNANDFGSLVYSTDGGSSWLQAGGPYTNQATAQTTTVSLPTSLNNTSFILGWKFTCDAAGGYSNNSFGVDNIILSHGFQTPVASTLNTSKSEYFSSNSDSYFYSASGEIIARVRSLSAHNYGCTDVIIDRAGTGATAFYNNNTGNRIMDKTFRIIPTTNNSSGSYEITLYYSQAEVTGWEAATGQSFNNIQLIKTAGQISSVTPATPNAAGTIDIVTPTRGTFGSNYTLTYTFSNGFSGFGAGVAGSALPVNLLDFAGHLKNNTVVLDWRTGSESNSKGFEIERSYDGNSFSKIGFVQAAGNSSTVRTYTFTDKDITQANNYYRLRQVDFDNKFAYSKVITIKNPISGQIPFNLLNNPVRNNLDIQFGEIADGKVQLRLTDMSGKLMMTWHGEKVANRRIRINIADKNLTKGVYILHAVTQGREYVEKVVVK